MGVNIVLLINLYIVTYNLLNSIVKCCQHNELNFFNNTLINDLHGIHYTCNYMFAYISYVSIL